MRSLLLLAVPTLWLAVAAPAGATSYPAQTFTSTPPRAAVIHPTSHGIPFSVVFQLQSSRASVTIGTSPPDLNHGFDPAAVVESVALHSADGRTFTGVLSADGRRWARTPGRYYWVVSADQPAFGYRPVFPWGVLDIGRVPQLTLSAARDAAIRSGGRRGWHTGRTRCRRASRLAFTCTMTWHRHGRTVHRALRVQKTVDGELRVRRVKA